MRSITFIILLGMWIVSGIGSAQYENQTGDQWWNDRVFYEVFVRSFYDSDGDGIGDFNGLIEKLDYLNDGDPSTTGDLGITGLWLMPIFPSPSYHGYDVTNYREINPDYGTLNDFRHFLAEAHSRGIAVILDFPINHTSSQHPWFVESSNPESGYADWYVWEDEDPGYGGPWGQQVWHELDGRYYYGVFWGGMPDLDFENPDVTMEMVDVSRFWLEEVGVDGFRMDAIKYMVPDGRIQENTVQNLAWLEAYRDELGTIRPDVFVVGEVWDETTRIALMLMWRWIWVLSSGSRRPCCNRQIVALLEH